MSEDLGLSRGSRSMGGVPSQPNCHMQRKFPPTLSRALYQPLDNLGGNFFFAMYIRDETPFSGAYYTWLTNSYFDAGTNKALRSAIDAIGMGGIFNTSPSPAVAISSKQHYCNALGAVKQALGDPVEAVADTTLLAVILLAFFEVTLHVNTALGECTHFADRRSTLIPGIDTNSGPLISKVQWLCLSFAGPLNSLTNEEVFFIFKFGHRL